jgi:acylphosphatase
MTHRLTATVHGFVQGVGFRGFVARHALRLGLTGYARNLSDGSVRVEAEGAASDLRDLVAELQSGPSMGEVESVDWRIELAEGEFTRFSIQ